MVLSLRGKDLMCSLSISSSYYNQTGNGKSGISDNVLSTKPNFTFGKLASLKSDIRLK